LAAVAEETITHRRTVKANLRTDASHTYFLPRGGLGQEIATPGDKPAAAP